MFKFNPLRSVQSGAALSGLAMSVPTILMVSRCQVSRFQSPQGPSQRPVFEHADLTCYTLLSPSITFSLFHSELKTQ